MGFSFVIFSMFLDDQGSIFKPSALQAAGWSRRLRLYLRVRPPGPSKDYQLEARLGRGALRMRAH